MKKTILITGSTDGIGLHTAKKLILLGHNVIIHGRDKIKVEKIVEELSLSLDGAKVDSFVADLSDLKQVIILANQIKKKYSYIDVLINNAGIYNVSEVKNADSLDIRFVVNTIAPYLLTKELFEIMDKNSRVINLSSAAQAPVELEAIYSNRLHLHNGEAYAQSKLALTMWSYHLSLQHSKGKASIIAINPKSFIGTKMVKNAYKIAGVDLNFGSDILVKASISDDFKNANGKYFDNDIEAFSSPHIDALNQNKCKNLVEAIEKVIEKYETK